MAATAAKRKKDWLPEGRDPWCDIYTERVLDRISQVIGGCTDPELDRLACDLAMAAEQAIIVEDETDFSMTKTARLRWIQENLVDPITVLRSALDPQHAPKTSLWPFSHELDPIDELHADEFEQAERSRQARPRFRDSGGTPIERSKQRGRPRSRTRRQKMLDELNWLEGWATNLTSVLSASSMKPSTARRDMFVEEVVLIYVKHFPDRDQAGLRPDGSTKLADFVKAAAAPVLRDAHLTGQIKRAVQVVRPAILAESILRRRQENS